MRAVLGGDLLDPVGELHVELRDALRGMGAQCELEPGEPEVDVRVMVQLLGDLREVDHDVDRRAEGRRGEGAAQCGPVPLPVGQLDQLASDLVRVQEPAHRAIVAECGLVSEGVDGGGADGVLVVAAAVIRDGRLLAARRTGPPELAGGWELPGGKVEPGESEADALVRELQEELGVTVEAGPPVGELWPMARGYRLRVLRAVLVDGEPQPLEDHDAVRWLEPGEWWSVLWLDADRAVVELLETTAREWPAPGPGATPS